MRYFFLLILILGIYSCDTHELFTFKKQHYTVDTMPECKNADCADIEINLLKIVDNTTIATIINKQIEQATCSILNIDENILPTNLTDAIHEFNTSYQDISEEFPDETTLYEASINCTLGFQSKSLISIAIDSYVYTGGAHGYGGISYINVDTKNGKQLSNKALFKDYSGFITHAEKVFRVKNNIVENDPINSTGFFFESEKFTLPENIGFTEAEVILFYNQYEISSYAEGPVELKLNKQNVASYFAFDIL